MGRRKKQAVPIRPNTRDALQAQREAFRLKFGRDPGPDDLVFFAEDADQPRAMTEDEITVETVRILERAGVRPELIHAYRRCGFMLNREMLPRLTNEELKEWLEAIKEYRELQGRRN